MEAKEPTYVSHQANSYGTTYGQQSPVMRWRSAYPFACFLGLTGVLITSWILTVFIFPFYDTVFVQAREVSLVANMLTLFVVALVAAAKPHVFRSHALIPGTALCLAAGMAIAVLGMAEPSVSMLVIGAALTAIARGVVTVLVGLAFLRMPLRHVGICVAGACLLAYLLRSFFLLLAPEAALSTFILAPFFALFLTYPYVRESLDRITAVKAVPGRSEIQPAAGLPFEHKVFISLFMLRIGYGFALTLSEAEGVPLSASYALIPLLIVFIAVLLYRKALDPDALFWAALMLIISGLLVLSGQPGESLASANTLLMAGAGCIDVFGWFLLIALASKSSFGSLSVFAWGLALSALGSLIGSGVGVFATAALGTDASAVSLVALAGVAVFVVLALSALRNFSFKGTIEGIGRRSSSVQAKAPAAARLSPRSKHGQSSPARSQSSQYLASSRSEDEKPSRGKARIARALRPFL